MISMIEGFAVVVVLVGCSVSGTNSWLEGSEGTEWDNEGVGGWGSI